MLSIYISRPISGRAFSEVFAYYDRVDAALTEMGYHVLSPMMGKDHLRGPDVADPMGANHPMSCPQAIFRRDAWMVAQADVVYVNLRLAGTGAVSIGCTMELAWAYQAGKYVVLVMEDENIHRHAFTLQAATVVWPTEREAMQSLATLARRTE